MTTSTPVITAGIHGHCQCPQEHWRVVHYHLNYSAFSGYHATHSAYSRLSCDLCGHTWRTKAAYVERIALQVPRTL